MEERGSFVGFILSFISGIYGIIIGLILFYLSITIYNYSYFKATGIILIITGIIILLLSFFIRNENSLKSASIILSLIGILETIVSILLILSVYFSIQGAIFSIQGIITILAGISGMRKIKSKGILLRLLKYLSIIGLILFIVFIIFMLYQVYYIKSNTKDYHSCSGPGAHEECTDIPCPDKPNWHKLCVDKVNPTNGKVDIFICSCFKSGPAM